MDIKIYPSVLRGEVSAPPSKSAAHRAVISACLADGVSRISNLGNNDDILATVSVMQALGGRFKYTDDALIVNGIKNWNNNANLNCNESGSTLRFLAPIVSAVGVSASFYGEGRLPQRPMEPILDILKNNGVSVDTSGDYMFRLEGKLNPGSYSLLGNISSQYLTGLLFALPLLAEDSKITLSTPLESSGYIDMTMEMLSHFGVRIYRENNVYNIHGNQQYKPTDIHIEGDYSGAAFWLSAGLLGHDIRVAGLNRSSTQADIKLLKVLENFGGNVLYNDNNIQLKPQKLSGVEIDGSEIPDSVPILAVVAALVKGNTRIYNAQRLKIKESDRLEATADGLNRMGAQVSVTEDGLSIHGSNSLNGGVTVASYNDHRIAMAMSIAALSAKKPVIIQGAECINKSYPEFYNHLKQLGGRFDVL